MYVYIYICMYVLLLHIFFLDYILMNGAIMIGFNFNMKTEVKPLFSPSSIPRFFP